VFDRAPRKSVSFPRLAHLTLSQTTAVDVVASGLWVLMAKGALPALTSLDAQWYDAVGRWDALWVLWRNKLLAHPLV
jgi:hypothetical protein